MAFDPRHPLPRTTEFNIRATAPAQASPVRLWILVGLGTAAFVAGLLLLEDWWLGLLALAAATFGVWGLAARATLDLDRWHDPATGKRLALHLLRVGAMALGIACLLFAAAMIVGTTVEWEPLMELLGR